MSVEREDIVVYDGVTKMFVHPMLNDEGDVRDGLSVDYRELHSNNAVLDNTIHCHEYLEMGFLIDGSASHLVNGQNIQMKKGYIHVMRRIDFHSVRVASGEKACFYYAAFNEDKISTSIYNRLMLHKGHIDCFLDEKNFERFKVLFQIMRDVYIDWNDNSEEIIKSTINTILAILLNNIVENESDTEYSALVQRALVYIEKHFLEQDCSLFTVSRNMNVTPNYLGRLIKNNMGMSFSQYCTRRKLSYSIQLLDNKMLSVSDVAEKAGFTSASYYISLFRNHYGLTPQKYMTIKDKKDI